MSEADIIYEGSLFSTVGGGGQHLRGLASAIAASGIDIQVIVPRSSELDGRGLKITKLPAPGPLPARLLAYEIAKVVEVLRQGYRRRGRATTYLTRLSASAPAVLAARLVGFRVVTEVNGPISEELAERGGTSGIIMSKVSRWLEASQLRNSEFVVCVAPPLEKYVHELHPGVPVKVLPNGAMEPTMDVSVSRPLPARIAYLGALSHWYDLELVQQAVARLAPGSRFEVIGDGTGLDTLRDKAESCTTIHGWLPPDTANELLAGCHVGVIPCREGTGAAALRSPLKLYHYLSMGLIPVVADVVELETDLLRYVVRYETGSAESLFAALTEALDVDRAELPVPSEIWSWDARAEEFLSWID